MRLRAVVLVAGLVGQSMTSAAGPRQERPRALSLGVSSVLDVSGDDLLPMPIVQLVWDVAPQLAALAEAGYVDYGDRIFGPRALGNVGARGYLWPGAISPYAALRLGLYHEFDVHYTASDRSQHEGDWLAADVVAGNEIATQGGFSWTIEVGVTRFTSLRRSQADRTGLHGQTMFGYRF